MSGLMDPTGFYCLVRLRDQRRGEKLNIGVIAFWRWGWATVYAPDAVARAVAAFPQVNEDDLFEFLHGMADHLGFKAPGEFDPNHAYVSIHQYRQQHWELGPVEFSTLRSIRIGHDGQYGYAGGVQEAAEDIYARLVKPPSEAEVEHYAA